MSQQNLAAKLAAGSDSKDEKVNGDSGLVCPECGGKLVRRSMRRSFLDQVKSLVGLWPYRCILCNARFNGPGPKEATESVDVEADAHPVEKP